MRVISRRASNHQVMVGRYKHDIGSVMEGFKPLAWPARLPGVSLPLTRLFAEWNVVPSLLDWTSVLRETAPFVTHFHEEVDSTIRRLTIGLASCESGASLWGEIAKPGSCSPFRQSAGAWQFCGCRLAMTQHSTIRSEMGPQ